MKEQLEEALQEWMETLEYFGEPISEGYMRGHSDTPDGLTVVVIDVSNPADESIVRNLRRGKMNLSVKTSGTIHFLYRKELGDETLPDAEERNDRIPEYVFQEMHRDTSLGGRIPGNVMPKNLKGGIFELENTEGTEFCMSRIEIEYNGSWIEPIVE